MSFISRTLSAMAQGQPATRRGLPQDPESTSARISGGQANQHKNLHQKITGTVGSLPPAPMTPPEAAGTRENLLATRRSAERQAFTLRRRECCHGRRLSG